MKSCLLYFTVNLLSLAGLVVGDGSLVDGIDYYISSTINPNFTTNLNGYSDGFGNWPGIGKDESGSPKYGTWYCTSVSGSSFYQLTNRGGFNLDITGGTSTAQSNPEPFLNILSNTSLDGQAGWVFVKAKETDLPNQDNGYWAAIVNDNWNLALRAPVMEDGSEYERLDLGPVPTAWDVGRYWFFASVTKTTVWSTLTVTGLTTIAGSPVTQTVNANGPTSTITSTIVQTIVSSILGRTRDTQLHLLTTLLCSDYRDPSHINIYTPRSPRPGSEVRFHDCHIDNDCHILADYNDGWYCRHGH